MGNGSWWEVQGEHVYNGRTYSTTGYQILKCGGCERGGMAKYHGSGVLEEFFPTDITTAPLPESVPEGTTKEIREAELCASVGAHRAGTALLRSALEKILVDNGYEQSNLKKKIEAAGNDGLINKSMASRAQTAIRDTANDILHGPWRPVDQKEYEDAHHYTQRIAESFYDHPEEVEKQLAEVKRKKKEAAAREPDSAE